MKTEIVTVGLFFKSFAINPNLTVKLLEILIIVRNTKPNLHSPSQMITLFDLAMQSWDIILVMCYSKSP